MTFATELLARHMEAAGIRVPDTKSKTTQTARGPVRLKKDGTPDKRSLLRGISKPSRAKGEVKSYEKKRLLKIFSGAKPGDVFVWRWRTCGTRNNPKLRAAQVAYLHSFCREFGYKVKTQGFTDGLHMTVLEV